MEDKRKLANQELEETLSSGILSVLPESQGNFDTLPNVPQTEDMMAQNVTNTFNVNVNVSGGGQSQIERATNRTMQNMLPNLTGSADEIKKNSSLILVDNSREISGTTETNNFEVASQEVLMNNLTPNNYSNETINQTNVYNTASEMPLFNFAKDSMDAENLVGKYTYSNSSLKEDNQKIAKDYQILKNITYNSFNDEMITTTISPYSAHDNSLYVENVMGERVIQNLENLTVENNTENNLEIANQISREMQSQQRSRNDLISQLTDNAQDEDFASADIQEATEVSPKIGVGAPVIGSNKNTNPSNIRGSLTNLPTIIQKMNSPPMWRTVLG